MEISESGSVILKLDSILSGDRPPLVRDTGYFYTPAYLAWLFIRVFGTLHSYFIFQCFLSTLTAFIVYRIVLLISDNKVAGIISILLITIYTEYLLLSSVFYNQTYEIFFCAVVLWLTLLLFREKNLLRSFVYIISICLVVAVSLLFRFTLLKIFYYFFAGALVCLITKHYRDFFKFLALTVILYLILVILKPIDLVSEPVGFRQSPFFWGHTLYGGKGGENGFIYKENEDLYNKRLKEYAAKNKIDTMDEYAIRQFRDDEITNFIKEEPHKWVFLQITKFFNTFGSIPQKDGLKMLMTGNIKMHWIVSAALLQIPFVFIILLFILTADYKIRTLFTLSNYKIYIYLLGLYLITAICFYMGFQERYRPVVMVLFFIPVIAVNYSNLKTLFLRENRMELYIRLAFVALFTAIWIYQAYDALVINPERYFKVIQ